MQTQDQPARSAKEQFDRQAPHYDAQWNTWSQETLDWLISRADLKPSDNVLDIATGTGFTALAFAPHVASVVATDVSTGMLEQGRRRAAEQGTTNVSFQEAGAENLPFSDSTFDVVTCRIAAHHFLDIRAFIAESFRVLKAGGRLLVADTTVPDHAPDATLWQNKVEVVRDPSHVNNYSPLEWSAMVKQAGFRLDEITTEGAGITIPLSDWIFKAGCTPEQERNVRQLFADAPESAKSAFAIVSNPAAGDIIFTWLRVVIKAVKAA